MRLLESLETRDLPIHVPVSSLFFSNVNMHSSFTPRAIARS